MQRFPITPREMISSFWRNRQLIAQMTRREVLGRYRGSVMGLAWSFFNPVLMLAVYTFVFSVVFRARWNPASDSKTEFALVLFAGLIVFNLFSECVNRSPSLILSNANYVKKVVFPLEILPWVSLGSALFHMLASFAVWLLFFLTVFGLPPLTLLLFPLVLLPLVLLTMGLSWLLASLGVYLRDVAQVVGIVTTALMFLSPIFYPISALPEAYQPLLHLNPMTLVIEEARGALIWGKVPGWELFVPYFAVTVLVAWAGFAWFQKTRRGFADVL
jgi:lipopolysaccharide transport system permease protein